MRSHAPFLLSPNWRAIITVTEDGTTGDGGTTKIDGSCHCGKVNYEAQINLDRVVICHCSDCRTFSGAPFRVVAFAEPGGFKLLSGALTTYIKTVESGNHRKQTFCPTCGTPIYASPAETNMPHVYVIRVGTIRQRAEFTPKLQIWTRSAQHWVPDLQHIRKEEMQGIKI